MKFRRYFIKSNLKYQFLFIIDFEPVSKINNLLDFGNTESFGNQRCNSL